MLTLEHLESYTQEFGKKYIAPITERVDRDGVFPKEVYDKLRENGYMGLLVPKEYGGLGGSMRDYIQVCYIFATFCPTTAICYTMHTGGVIALSKFGSKELKEELLPKIAKGEIVIAIAYRESSSHLGISMSEREEVKNGIKGVVLNGEKSFVTSSNYADFFLTYTNSCKVEGGRNNWLVPSNSLGISIHGSSWDGLGMRGNNSAPVTYDNVWVDSKYRIGEEGGGNAQTDYTMIYGILGFCGVYSGLGRRAYECILEHTKTRKYSNGSTLSQIGSVQVELANIYTKVASQHALTFRAVEAYERGDKDALSLAFGARLNATNHVIEICTLAMRLGGGIAYNKKLPLERYLRDSYASLVMVPAPHSLKIWLSEEIIK